MTHRYYFPDATANSTAVLEGPEAHHFLHVMRGQAGDALTLFDGRGHEFPALATACRKLRVEMQVGEANGVDRELPWNVILGVALPKGDRQR